MRWAREIIALDEEEGSPCVGGDEEEFTEGYVHAVPLSIRVAVAELLIRHGFRASAEVVKLVPPDTQSTWPNYHFNRHGLQPFETLISLAVIRQILPDAAGRGAIPPATGSSSADAGRERLRRALCALVEMEGQALAAAAGLGEPPKVAAQAGPIIRLLEVPGEQTRDWVGWYSVADVALDMFRRVVILAAECGSIGGLARLLMAFEEAWSSPYRARYWTPERQQAVLVGALKAHPDARSLVIEHLERLDSAIDAHSYDPHDRASNWLSQARAWAAAGEPRAARIAAESAVRSSLGVDSSDHDRQLVEWIEWLRVAVENGELDIVQFADVVSKYSARIAVAAPTSANQAESAAEKLIDIVFPFDVSLGCELAEWLCDGGAIAEVNAIQAVVLGACRHKEIPISIGAAAATQVLYPVSREPSNDVYQAVKARHGEDPSAVAALQHARQLWVLGDSAGEDVDTELGDDLEQSGIESGDTPLGAETIGALLTQLRRATSIHEGPRGGWDDAVRRTAPRSVSTVMARALLGEATRLGLRGAALGGIAALAARSGEAATAAGALASSLSRTPGYGWLRHFDGGTRLTLFGAALQDRHPSLVEVARNDLANSLTTGSLSGQLSPDDIRRIVELVAGPETIARAWPGIEAYLDVAVPVDDDTRGPSIMASVAPLLAFARWITSYLGHPIRPLDFGARRMLQIISRHDDQVGQQVLSEAVQRGGWVCEGALLALITMPVGDRPTALRPGLVAAVADAAIGADGVCRDLARRLAQIYALPIPRPSHRPLPARYELTLPPLPERAPPEFDRHGTPHLDPHDPQQIVAPFDPAIRLIARMADLDESAVLHHAATIALASGERWVQGGHQGHASLLKRRQQMHTHRPWAYLAGRRALGTVLAELDDSGVLGRSPALLAYSIRLLDEQLARVSPAPVPSWMPLPWRPDGTHDHDTRGWCSEVGSAAREYRDLYSAAAPYVLAELGEWCRLDWGKPKEERRVYATHPDKAAGLLVPAQSAWEVYWAGAHRYPGGVSSDWSSQELVLCGYEGSTDAPHVQWLALHPVVGEQLGWIPDSQDLFRWTDGNGEWRARTVFIVRGQLSHQPPGRAACGEVWQVQLSEKGYAELRAAFPTLRRSLHVSRTLPASNRYNRGQETSSSVADLTDPL